MSSSISARPYLIGFTLVSRPLRIVSRASAGSQRSLTVLCLASASHISPTNHYFSTSSKRIRSLRVPDAWNPSRPQLSRTLLAYPPPCPPDLLLPEGLTLAHLSHRLMLVENRVPTPRIAPYLLGHRRARTLQTEVLRLALVVATVEGEAGVGPRRVIEDVPEAIVGTGVAGTETGVTREVAVRRVPERALKCDISHSFEFLEKYY